VLLFRPRNALSSFLICRLGGYTLA
jgi:hypothetical protein